MCGIAGIVSAHRLDNSHVRVVQGMLEALRHRGPDDEGTYSCDFGMIGMRRLSIIDLASGGQPFFDESGRWIMVFNGEIYNYKELRRELQGKGHVFRSQSDGEVVVHLAEESGLEFVDRIKGMYAIALYDSFSRTLWLIRDRLGKKPLYYSRTGSTLLFSSELKSLIRSGMIDPTVDERAVFDYLNYLYIPFPRSIYRNISKLAPGGILRFSGGDISLERYWSPARSLRQRGDKKETFDIEELSGRIETAVERRLQSDVDVGILLSGGLDSSLVAAHVSRLSRNVQAFTLGFTEGNSEVEFASEVARRLGIRHNVEYLSLSKASERIPAILSQLDEPFGDSSAVATYFVNDFLGRRVRVGLSGDGGDEVFGGYKAYRYMKVLSLAKKVVRENPGKRWDNGVGGTHRVGNLLARSRMGYADAWLSLKDFLGPDLRRCLDRGFLERNKDMTGEYLRESFNENLSAEDPVDTCMRTDLQTYLTGDILYKVDMMSMVSSVEMRSPFLDEDVIDYMFSFPSWPRKVGLWSGKKVLKKLALRHLPASIVHRKKAGFTIPVHEWFAAGLLNELKDKIRQGPREIDSILSREKIGPVLDGWKARGDGHSAQKLWSIYVLVHWIWENSARGTPA